MWMGVFLALVTGVLWIVVGIILRYAGNRIKMLDATLLYSLLQLPFFLWLLDGVAEFSSANFWHLLGMLLAGVVNVWATLLLQKAMADGNSGVSWAIGQSALVSSFVTGILFFGEEFSIIRCSGAVLIVCGMVVLGFSQRDPRSNVRSSRRWLWYAFAAFLLLCFAQATVAAGSNWQLSSGMRGALMTIGAIGFCVGRKYTSPERGFVFNKVMWVTVLGLAVVGLVSEMTNFIALDYLAEVNLSGIGYPLCLGSCIAGFALYSALVLREKTNPATWCGILLIVLGIFLMPNYSSFAPAPEALAGEIAE